MELARRQVYPQYGPGGRPSPVVLLFARAGGLHRFEPRIGAGCLPPNRRVWAVGLEGVFPPASCGPMRSRGSSSVNRCLVPDHHALVIVDSATGRFVLAVLSP